MPLLSGMMRMQAITGSTDTLGGYLAGRQGGRWARQTVAAAMPTPAKQARLRELTELRQLGVVTDAEFKTLRSRLGL